MLILWGFSSPIFKGGGGGGGVTKTIYMGNCLKGGLEQFAEGLTKNRKESVFEGFGGLIP